MLDGVIVPIQVIIYGLLYFLAEIFWGLNQALLLVGYYILTITSWLSESMFQPLLASIGNSTDSLLLPVFTLAMLILAITYLLGVFGVFRVVEFRSAIVWLLVAVMWFQFGPEIYLGFEQFRRNLSGGFYATTFSDLTGGGGSIEGIGQIGDAGDMNIDPPQNNFGAFLPFDTSIDGLDIAMAYLNANGCDVLRAAGCTFQPLPDGSIGQLPSGWYEVDGYFELSQHSFFFQYQNNEERQESLDDASRGIWLGLSGLVVSLFGMIEQIVQLLLTIAFGIAFASFFVAILFAFFKKTEPVTWAVFDIILGLFVQSIITSLLLALVMAFVSLAGATGNGILLLGVGFLGILLGTILLLAAIKAIQASLNGLMGAFGQATGGNLNAGGSLTEVGTAYATGTATLASGGSAAQALGAALGPDNAQKAYYASQAFGGNKTMLGRFANDVSAGATASYLGPAGGVMLGLSGQNETPGSFDVARRSLGTPIRVSSNDSFEGNLSSLTAGGDTQIRQDPLTAEPYTFTAQNNGQGRRTYGDGSQLYTTLDDTPLNRNRARDERRVRQFDRDTETRSDMELADTSISAIDASDDEENAVIQRDINILGSLLRPGAANSPETPTALSDSPQNRPLPEPANFESDSTSDDAFPDFWPATQNNISDDPATQFVREFEQDYPGSTGIPLDNDPDSDYRPDVNRSDMSSGADEIAAAVDATNNDDAIRLANAVGAAVNNSSSAQPETDAVQLIPQIDNTTSSRLQNVDITTAGELANSQSEDLANQLSITPVQATFLIQQAQDYLASAGNREQTVSNRTDSVSNTSRAGEINPIDQKPDTRSNDDVQSVSQVGPITARRLGEIGITTAGQLASASPQNVSRLPSMSSKRAKFLINQAQNYVSTANSDASNSRQSTRPAETNVLSQTASADPGRFAAAIDATNNDDSTRLATAVGAAVASASSGSNLRVPDTSQAIQLAAEAGLPQTTESGRFVQVASAMQLSPRQAQQVVQDVSSGGHIGTEVAGAIRQSLAGVANRNGQTLNNGGIARAVGSLERAAQALVNSSQSTATSSGNQTQQKATAEKATSGSTSYSSTNQLD